MGNAADIERITQDYLVKVFKEKLGYTYPGNWEDSPHNGNIEESLLTSYFSKKGYHPTLSNKTPHDLRFTAGN